MYIYRRMLRILLLNQIKQRHLCLMNCTVLAPIGLAAYSLIGTVYASNDSTNKNISMKDKLISAYENKIRHNSSPEKVFKYFASLIDETCGEMYMTPEDFVSSFTNNCTFPEQRNGFTNFKSIDKNNYKTPNSSEKKAFEAINQNCLISYYVFLLLHTLLYIPKRNLNISFKLMDANDDGFVSINEFNNYIMTFFKHTHFSNTRRDVLIFQQALSQRDILKSYFNSGEKGVMRLDQFLEFCNQLKRDVMKIEFDRFNPIDDKLSETQFAQLITCNSSHKKALQQEKLKKYSQSDEEQNGISFDDYVAFSSLFEYLGDIDVALSFLQGSGVRLDKTTLQKVVQKVTNTSLRPHLIDVIFDIFDVDNDGRLSRKELILTLKDCQFKGLRVKHVFSFFNTFFNDK